MDNIFWEKALKEGCTTGTSSTTTVAATALKKNIKYCSDKSILCPRWHLEGTLLMQQNMYACPGKLDDLYINVNVFCIYTYICVYVC